MKKLKIKFQSPLNVKEYWKLRCCPPESGVPSGMAPTGAFALLDLHSHVHVLFHSQAEPKAMLSPKPPQIGD